MKRKEKTEDKIPRKEETSSGGRPYVTSRRGQSKEETSSKRGQSKEEKNIAGAVCSDSDCHIHGNLKTRGRVFEGKVIKKFDKRVVIEFERTIYIRKYERYKKSRTKIHARLPNCMKDNINIGDYIKVQECRPLSKIIHFAVIEKIRDAELSEKGHHRADTKRSSEADVKMSSASWADLEVKK